MGSKRAARRAGPSAAANPTAARAELGDAAARTIWQSGA